MWRVLQSLFGIAILAASARASPFWIRYDAAEGQFPEEQSWERVINYGPPTERWFENGALVIDSRGSTLTQDYYRSGMDAGLEPSGVFIARWRLLISEVAGVADPGVHFVSEDLFGVGFAFGYNRFASIHESPSPWIYFTPGVFHTYELRSADMRQYELYIDDIHALTGQFLDVFGPPRAEWGDLVSGGASLGYWQFYEYGVLAPEGSSAAALFTALCIARRRGTNRQWISN